MKLMKPREKLFKYGVEKLNNSELLAVILGHATKKENVFNLSQRLINEYGEKTICRFKDAEDLKNFFNIGKVQAAKIIACFELGRRFYKNEKNNNVISSADDVLKRVHHMRELNKECMHGIYLSSRYHVLHEEILSIGTLEQAQIYLRDVFYPALLHSAYGFILVHNHPSGDENPSCHDISVTVEISKAAKIMGIQFLDHVIVAGHKYFSFNNAKKLNG